MKRVIVIGANSYIARNFIFLLKQKSDIKIIGLYDYSEEHIDGESNYYKISILDKDSISLINMKCDIIYFFVGKTGTINGFEDYNTFIDINEIALLNVLTEYRKQESKAKIIFPSTRLVYKGSEKLLNEDSEKEFKTIYAMNKWACENYLKQYNSIFGVKYLILRICVPYGTMIPNASSYGTAEFMLEKAKKCEKISLYGDGSQKRTIIHMRDLCNIIYYSSVSKKCVNNVFNIGGETYSLYDMANLIAAKYNVDIVFTEWPLLALKIESGSTIFDSKKLDSLLDIRYEVKFADWITQVI